MENQTQTQLSHDAKTIIVVLLLVLSFPIGLIFMWFWMKTWPKWVKILLTVAPLLFILMFVLLGFTFYKVGTSTVQRFEPKSYKQSPTPTADPTANWKTYTNQQFAFEFKYPESFVLREQEGKDPAYQLSVYSTQYESPYVELWFQVSTRSEEAILEALGESIWDKRSFMLNGIKMNKYVGYGGPAGGVYHERVFFRRGDLTYNFNLGSYNKQPINQILQTFKFTDDDSQGVVCAQDVRVCPDGSYVGRQPPRCEFTPCP